MKITMWFPQRIFFSVSGFVKDNLHYTLEQRKNIYNNTHGYVIEVHQLNNWRSFLWTANLSTGLLLSWTDWFLASRPSWLQYFSLSSLLFLCLLVGNWYIVELIRTAQRYEVCWVDVRCKNFSCYTYRFPFGNYDFILNKVSRLVLTWFFESSYFSKHILLFVVLSLSLKVAITLW